MAALAAVATPASAPAIERIDWAMNGVNIEIPSWGFVNTGTRFRVFPQQGVPRTVFEKIDDAATVNRYTGIAGLRVAPHPVGQGGRLRGPRGLRRASAGSPSAASTATPSRTRTTSSARSATPTPRVRAKAVDAIIECCEIAGAMDAQAVKVWLGDGTNYPGQDDLRVPPPAAGRGPAGGLRAPARGRPAVPRVQALRAGALLHRRPGLGPEPQRRRASWATRPASASTPATTRWASTSSRSWRSCWPRAAWPPSTSTTRSTATTT